MPEGHTLHRLAKDHRRALRGRSVGVSSPQGRFAEAAARLDGRALLGVEAHGKHLFYDFGAGDIVHVHLGLFGKFFDHPTPAPAPRATVRMRLVGPDRTVDLVGATECALLDPDGRQAILDRLGPDPLRRDADPEQAWEKLRRRRIPVGQAVMDQTILSGVGNVYRAEVLHVLGVHPLVPANQLSRAQFDELWATLVRWLAQGVKDGVIITVDPVEVGKRRSRIAKGEALWVYKQDACRRCGGEVRRWDLAGRWAYACERCQPPPRPAGR